MKIYFIWEKGHSQILIYMLYFMLYIRNFYCIRKQNASFAWQRSIPQLSNYIAVTLRSEETSGRNILWDILCSTPLRVMKLAIINSLSWDKRDVTELVSVQFSRDSSKIILWVMSTVEVANLFQVPQLNLPPRKKAIFLLLFNWRHLTFNAFMIYVCIMYY